MKKTASHTIAKESSFNPRVTPIKNNPPFRAQFDLNLKLLYTYTPDGQDEEMEVCADLPDGYGGDMPCYIFGNNDFNGKYHFGLQQLPPPGNWFYDDQGIYDGVMFGNTTPFAGVAALLTRGDFVMHFTATNGADVYSAYVFVHCAQVAYGTLLSAIQSDIFKINNIRYKIADQTKVAQYSNQIEFLSKTLFGKVGRDSISPESQLQPEQFQVNTVDIPINWVINKENGLATYIDCDAGLITWSVFVETYSVLK